VQQAGHWQSFLRQLPFRNPACRNPLKSMPRRRRQRFRLIRDLSLAIAVAIVFLMGVLPLVEWWWPFDPDVNRGLEWIRSRVMEVLIALWFFAFGSMVGSFVNVVVWRMPRGVSVVSHGSACPWCLAKIRLSDNIPVLGWIKLGGRCRVCRLPISRRYPLVEAVFGFVFLLMFFVELQSAGGNLPGGPRYVSTGILQVVISTRWDLILVYSYHMLLLVMLMTWSLMAFDGSRIPRKTIGLAWLAGLAGPLLDPSVQPVRWSVELLPWLTQSGVGQSLFTGFAGWLAGGLAGGLLQALVSGGRDRGVSGRAVALSLATVGLFTGWQFTTLVTFLFGWLVCLRRWLAGVRWIPSCGLVANATLMVLCLWRWLPGHGQQQDLPMLAAATLAGLLLTAAGSGFAGHRHPPAQATGTDVREVPLDG
jgi:prepilin signal peptidase PulO-like enzyme (type II secretory pathway)